MSDTATLTKATGARRGATVAFRTPGQFHRCWYPVALSSEIEAGQVVGAPFLDGRVVILRTADGEPRVLSAYCRHLGVDLSLGRMVDDELECPFHRWRYEGGGACVATASGDPAPKAARLFAYPTAESLGIIWAFNGEKAEYPVPRFTIDEEALAFEAFRNPVIMPLESSVVVLNAFDLQHFRVVHHMAIDVDLDAVVKQDSCLDYVAQIETEEFGAVTQQRRLWGVNTVTVEGARQNGRPIYLMHGALPTGEAETRGFLVVATPRQTEADSGDESSEQMLATARAFSLRLIEEDRPIFEGIRFRKDCLTGSDAFLAVGIHYLASFPQGHPGADFIR